MAAKNYFKYRQRFFHISGYGVHQILIPFTQFLVSLLVIRIGSEKVWGEIVSYLIVLNVMIMAIHWGNSSYLLRIFSPAQSTIAQLWQTSFVSRGLIAILCIIVLCILYYRDALFIYLLIWLSGAYIYRSFDVLSLYTRKFRIAIIIEISSLALMLCYVFYFQDLMSSALILKYYAIISIYKSALYIFFFRQLIFKVFSWKFSWSFLALAFPFFVPVFMSYLQSQVDIYTIAYLMMKEDLGMYQVFIKFFFFILIAINIGIGPYIKNIYRLPRKSFSKMNALVFKFGILFSIPFTALIYFIMQHIYQLEYPPVMFVLGYLMIIPFFGYVIKIHELLKYFQQKKLIYTSAFELILNLILNLSLIPILGLTGAILATVIVQWITLALFSMYVKSARLRHEESRT